jgi:BCD family chlorophyll transporter-like MFS transporter
MLTIKKHRQERKKTQKAASAVNYWILFRLSSFQIGSAMGDILATSIWNRILITNFGIPALPVSLLIAIRYFLSPISLWAGYMSDTRLFLGLRRTGYIWVGRSLMVLSLPLLGVSVEFLSRDTGHPLGWGAAALSTAMYGFGTLISGGPYLALVKDSVPYERRGLAVSLAEIFLITFFAVSGLVFALWMEEYDPVVFWQMIMATMVIGGFFWVFAIFGEEGRQNRLGFAPARPEGAAQVSTATFLENLRQIWSDKRTRGFFIFLATATTAAWAQDAILEPFGADTFALPFSRTTRLNTYWQGATVLTLLIGAYAWRKRPSELQNEIASWGLRVMAGGMGLLAVTALFTQVRLLELSLFIFGAGFGVYTFGGVSLLAVMSSKRQAGAYLGLWTVSILLFRGVGIFLGGALRDLFFLNWELSAGLSYGVVFALEAVGLAIAAAMIARLDVRGFAREVGHGVDRTEAQVAAAD